MKGIKKCGKCSHKCGPRTKICPKCGSQFKFSPKVLMQPKGDKVSWRELQKHDLIRTVEGYGPYYIDSNNNKIFMGHNGTFTVIDIETDGILAYAGKKGGYAFIYMGETKTGITGCIMAAHKIVKLKRRE